MTQAPSLSRKPDLDGLKLPHSPKSGSGGGRSFPWRFIAFLVVVAVVVGGFFVVRGAGVTGESASDSALLFTVARDDLRITVVEAGSLESENSIDIKSELEGRVQILTLVDEGTFAKKGDLLVELDAADLIDRERVQDINYERAKASLIQAQKNYEIQESNGESDIKQAELDVKFAGMDLEKYKEGDWPQQKKEALANITIAEEERKRARDKRDWSEKLAAKGYVNRQELEADILNVTKRQLDLELSQERLKVLEAYTHPKQMEALESDHEEFGKALDRVRKRVEGEMAQAEADLKAKEATHEVEKERLERYREQIAASKLYAPQDGLVVYRNEAGRMGRSSQEMIEEGASVRERQTIIVLPDTSNMIAKIKIHESAYDRVREGQKAYITLDAFADKVFPARLSFVGPIPDSSSWWMNPDLKVYSAEVKLGGNTTMLKPGMSCSVEIEVDVLEDVLYVPIQSVFRKEKTSFCYVRANRGVVAKPVRVGLHNDRLIHVTEGLEDGDRVYLAPPPGSEDIDVPMVENEPGVDMPADEDFPDVSPRKAPKLDPQASGDGGFDFKSLMNMSPEERARRMEEYQNLSPEEQEKLRERMMGAFGNMSSEQREEMMKRGQEGGGASGMGGMGGHGPGGEGGNRPEGMRGRGPRGEGGGERGGRRPEGMGDGRPRGKDGGGDGGGEREQ